MYEVFLNVRTRSLTSDFKSLYCNFPRTSLYLVSLKTVQTLIKENLGPNITITRSEGELVHYQQTILLKFFAAF